MVTHGESDEQALAQVLATDAGYVSLIASRRRAAVILERLRQRGLPAERLGRLKAPAGLDIGAATPKEIAVSVLAEIIHEHRSAKVEPLPVVRESRDPICGMMVEVAAARYRSTVADRTVYFCCLLLQGSLRPGPRGAPGQPQRMRSFVSGLVLAAGASTRLGQPKQLLPFGSTTLLGWVLAEARAATALDEVIVVSGVRPPKSGSVSTSRAPRSSRTPSLARAARPRIAPDWAWSILAPRPWPCY